MCVWRYIDDGQLLHEMILVCNAMKNYLTHPNEYIRGSTLRFLCQINDEQILESLIPSILSNLENRHFYVRKNSVLCIYHIHQSHPELIPDAIELIETYLNNESNPSCKRNGFLILYLMSTQSALNYLHSTILDSLHTYSDSFQLIVLQIIRNTIIQYPELKSNYIKSIFSILNNTTSNSSLLYDSAHTLIVLSSAPTAVRAAVLAYCSLLKNESDNNIKLIILQKLNAIKKRNVKILQDLIFEILICLHTPNIDIRQNILLLVISLLTPNNVVEVVGILKKQLISCDGNEFESVNGIKSVEYKKLLIDQLYNICHLYKSQIYDIMNLLMNYITDENIQTSLDIIYFIRETVITNTEYNTQILTKLMEQLQYIKSMDVIRVAVWIISEYSTEPQLVDLALTSIRSCIMDTVPFNSITTTNTIDSIDLLSSTDTFNDSKINESEINRAVKSNKQPLILADGTYATQSAVSQSTLDTPGSNINSTTTNNNHTMIRNYILAGEWNLVNSLLNALTKLTLRFISYNQSTAQTELNTELSSTLLLFVRILRYGKQWCSKSIDSDTVDRITQCIYILLNYKKYMYLIDASNYESNQQFITVTLQNKNLITSTTNKSNHSLQLNQIDLAECDDLIVIRQLMSGADNDIVLDSDDIYNITGSKSLNTDITTQLNRIYALTGYNDMIYAETQLTVNDYDIILNITIQNQTTQLINNMNLELHTSGDLKLIDRLSSYNVAPLQKLQLQVTIKMTSTESGMIFGNIIYDDDKSGGKKSTIVLNNIHMDVMDYIIPSTISDIEYRSMWAEFEWENKVAVNTDIQSIDQYLSHIIKLTNMNNLTPSQYNTDTCNFLAANLYARSMFHEDALLNLSVEKNSDTGKISGYIRIRSKTQGIALSLGDKITAKQRSIKA